MLYLEEHHFLADDRFLNYNIQDNLNTTLCKKYHAQLTLLVFSIFSLILMQAEVGIRKKEERKFIFDIGYKLKVSHAIRLFCCFCI